MSKTNAMLHAGLVLKKLINKYYNSQEEFAYDFGVDLRTVSRYVNNGIKNVELLQELAEFFDINIIEFFAE